jgi:hypothetical protein
MDRAIGRIGEAGELVKCLKQARMRGWSSPRGGKGRADLLI